MNFQNCNEIGLLKEIIKLNKFDDNVKTIFGYQRDDSFLIIVTDNLFKVFMDMTELNLSDMEDVVFDMVFNSKINPENDNDINKLYKKLMKLKEN